MKKALFTIFAALFLFTSASFAHETFGGNNQYGGYTGASQAQNTVVSNIKNLRDGQFVTLKGNIVAKVGHEKYTFKDSTGSILVEIDDDNWGGLQVSGSDTVIISGEVDKDWNSLSVEVDTISIAN